MGSNGASKGGGRTDAGAKRTTAQKYTPASKKDRFGHEINTGNYQTINEKGKVVGSSFISEGANKSNKDIKNSSFGVSQIVGSIFSGPLAKGAKYNRESFVNQVVGNTKKGGIRIDRKEWDAMSDTKKESIYGGYIKDKQSGKTDYYGRNIIGGDSGSKNNQPTIIKKNIGGNIIQTTAPTTAEISQSAAADAAEYDLRKTKKKGRSMTILTSSRGVKPDEGLTLGKKSLLGA